MLQSHASVSAAVSPSEGGSTAAGLTALRSHGGDKRGGSGNPGVAHLVYGTPATTGVPTVLKADVYY